MGEKVEDPIVGRIEYFTQVNYAEFKRCWYLGIYRRVYYKSFFTGNLKCEEKLIHQVETKKDIDVETDELCKTIIEYYVKHFGGANACHKGVEYLEKQGAEAFCSWYYGGEA